MARTKDLRNYRGLAATLSLFHNAVRHHHQLLSSLE
jgi:hypothetical protein